MTKRKIKRPILMFIGRKSRLWFGGSLGLMAVLGVIGVWLLAGASHTFLPGQASLPVNAATIDDSSIQFQFEPIKQDISGENYFVNYRLKREQFRQETKEMLSELLNSNVEKTKEQAQEKWLELSTKIQKEEELENLLKIKGFPDAVSDVFPENVAVIIYAPSLAPNEVSIIQDLVMRVTKVRLDKITITAKK